jgi:putative effector of murein hydrolase LrgA (UPF0299 family)
VISSRRCAAVARLGVASSLMTAGGAVAALVGLPTPGGTVMAMILACLAGANAVATLWIASDARLLRWVEHLGAAGRGR